MVKYRSQSLLYILGMILSVPLCLSFSLSLSYGKCEEPKIFLPERNFALFFLGNQSCEHKADFPSISFYVYHFGFVMENIKTSKPEFSWVG